MVKRPAILAALFATCAIMAAYAVQPLCIDGLTYLEVNDSRQCLLIRSSDPDNPVLLYLHGGPGQSLIPFAHGSCARLFREAQGAAQGDRVV